MIKLFICEDELIQREILEKNISFMIDESNYAIEIALSTEDPQELIDYLRSNPSSPSIYFLDIELAHSLNGIKLATEIRKQDEFGKIIFISSHDQYLLDVYKENIEAFDYIIKSTAEEIENSVSSVLEKAYSNLSNLTKVDSGYFKVNQGDRIQLIPLKEILFFVTTPIPHKIDLHHKKGELSFYSSLSKILIDNPRFIKCHRSYLVNIDNIDSIEKKQRVLIMNNGETCLCSYFGMKKVLSQLKEAF